MALLPVFRLRNGAEHFYTISPAERDGAVANYGYTYEEIAFYAYDSAAPSPTDDKALWTSVYITVVASVSAVDNNGQNRLSIEDLATRAVNIADACLSAFNTRWP